MNQLLGFRSHDRFPWEIGISGFNFSETRFSVFVHVKVVCRFFYLELIN